eukprot:gene3256-543_t
MNVAITATWCIVTTVAAASEKYEIAEWEDSTPTAWSRPKNACDRRNVAGIDFGVAERLDCWTGEDENEASEEWIACSGPQKAYGLGFIFGTERCTLIATGLTAYLNVGVNIVCLCMAWLNQHEGCGVPNDGYNTKWGYPFYNLYVDGSERECRLVAAAFNSKLEVGVGCYPGGGKGSTKYYLYLIPPTLIESRSAESVCKIPLAAINAAIAAYASSAATTATLQTPAAEVDAGGSSKQNAAAVAVPIVLVGLLLIGVGIAWKRRALQQTEAAACAERRHLDGPGVMEMVENPLHRPASATLTAVDNSAASEGVGAGEVTPDEQEITPVYQPAARMYAELSSGRTMYEASPNGVRYENQAAVHALQQGGGIVGRGLDCIRQPDGDCAGGNLRAFAVDEGKKKRGRYTLTIEAVAQRYYSVHMYRVVAVMALFSLASIVAFCGDPEVNALERLGITFTLMLTATAYSLVIASGLPTLGYLTFLDKYILATFSFIALVGAEITVIDWVAARHSASPDQPLYNAEDALEFASYADLALWLTIHVGLYIYVSRYVLPEGVPSTCFGGWTNGEWKYIGKTADGRPYYKQWDSYDSMFYFMYYEKDCDGNAGNTGKPQWTLAEKEPSVTADSDLDQDGKCVTYSGHTLEPTTASTPPSGVVWHIGCSNTHYTPLTLTFDEVCPPAPEFKYEWGNWIPQQNDGTVCGGQDQREAREVCAALVGCGGSVIKRTSSSDSASTNDNAAPVAATTSKPGVAFTATTDATATNTTNPDLSRVPAAVVSTKATKNKNGVVVIVLLILVFIAIAVGIVVWNAKRNHGNGIRMQHPAGVVTLNRTFDAKQTQIYAVPMEVAEGATPVDYLVPVTRNPEYYYAPPLNPPRLLAGGRRLDYAEAAPAVDNDGYVIDQTDAPSAVYAKYAEAVPATDANGYVIDQTAAPSAVYAKYASSTVLGVGGCEKLDGTLSDQHGLRPGGDGARGILAADTVVMAVHNDSDVELEFQQKSRVKKPRHPTMGPPHLHTHIRMHTQEPLSARRNARKSTASSSNKRTASSSRQKRMPDNAFGRQEDGVSNETHA